VGRDVRDADLPTMSKFGKTLFDLLRRIDGEATARPDGLPTGIRWYNGHMNHQLPLTTTSRVEDLWSARLVESYRERGLTADAQSPYPGTRKRCDLVITSPRGKRFWIEVKGGWTECIYPGGTSAYQSFKKYLYSTADDIDKLLALSPPAAHDLGLLLVAFDRLGRPVQDRHLDVVRSRATGWSEECDEWDERHWVGHRVRCWFWWKHL
jgi:hypothetical protein